MNRTTMIRPAMLLALAAAVALTAPAGAAMMTVNDNNGTIQWPTPNPAPPPANGTTIQTGTNLNLPQFDPTLGLLTQVDLRFTAATLYGGTIRNFSGSTWSGALRSNTGTTITYSMAPLGTLWNFNAPAEGNTPATSLLNLRTSFNLQSPTRTHSSPVVTVTDSIDLLNFVGFAGTPNILGAQRYVVNLTPTPTRSGVAVATFQRSFNPRVSGTYHYNEFLAPVGGDGGLDFSLTDGVSQGPGSVTPTDLGGSLGNSVSSEAPGGVVEETTSYLTSFKFTPSGGGTGQRQVFINAFLDGMLAANGGGVASVHAHIQLEDAEGNFINLAMRDFDADSQAAGNGPVNLNVDEVFGLSALLNIGDVYRLHGEMTLRADPRTSGSASADFGSTFLFELSGEEATDDGGSDIPEPASGAMLAALGLLTLRRRR